MRQKKKYPLRDERYGLWTVIGNEYVKNKRYEKFIMCRCDCGAEKLVLCKNLVYKESKSCISCAQKTHGDKGKYLYRVWRAMKQRCDSDKHLHFKYYGGRGISVCDKWQNSYAAFKKHAVKNGYVEGLEIDRIDTDGNYKPGNVRWVTRGENARNRRWKRMFFAFDEHKTVHEWSLDPRCIVSKKLLILRVYSKWDMERALITPKQQNKILVTET